MLSRASLLRKRMSAPFSVARNQISKSHHFYNADLAIRNNIASASCSTILYDERHGSLNNNSIKALFHSPSNFPTHRPYRRYDHQQIRHFAGRKDRYSASFETRPPTKKQRKAYHRRKRKQEYEKNKHSAPFSKAGPRRAEEAENRASLIEIAKEEEVLKRELSLYYDKVKELQGKIEESDTFQSLARNDVQDQGQIRLAAREAAMKAAEKEGVKHPPLPSWWQERLTYDWGDALVDDLMGNSADLTSSPNPFPHYMGKEYGRLRRKVERALRSAEIEKRLSLEDGEQGLIGGKLQHNNYGDVVSLPMESDHTSQLPSQFPSQSFAEVKLSDELISDLLRSHRDFKGKRTTPVGLAPSLELLFEDLQIPRSSLGTFSYVSLLTCCKSPWEARMVNEMRQEDGVRSNGYFWSAMVDVYARSGDYRGAESVLEEMMEETQAEYAAWKAAKQQNANADGKSQQSEPPIAIPPLPAYTSFFSACYKLISRGDVHPSIKSDAGKRAWNRWKEMRIHSVAPDVMAYGAMLRVFAAQGRAEKALDMIEEIMAQMMVPVSAEGILNGNGNQLQDNILRSLDGDGDGWYDDRDGNTVRVKPTTLLFTSALKAVAKSHEIAIRFNGGKSKNNRIRESITSYHGRLARKIVILAEQAEVDQDDGFISALMLCAAAAGDSSTARAIYLASKVRRLDHLRTCGGKEHLKKLQGLIPKEEREMIGQGAGNALSLGGGRSSSGVSTLRTVEEEYKEQHQAYELREYGTDTRILNTLLLSHAKAMEAKGLGSMWAGQFNRGYLCENSLRWIEAFNIPKMVNDAIPGISHTEAGLAAEGWQPEDFGDEKGTKQLRKNKKFSMKSIMDDGDQNLRDDLDPEFAGYDDDADEDNDLNFLQLVDGKDEVTRDWLSDDQLLSNDDHSNALELNNEMRSLRFIPNATEDWRSAGIEDDFGFDSDDDESEDNRNSDSHDVDFELDLAMKRREDLIKSMGDISIGSESGSELMLNDDGKNVENEDDDLDQYMTEEDFLALMNGPSKESLPEGLEDELDSIPGVKSNNFAAFCAHVKAELRAEGSLDEFNESDTRQLFDMMRTYYENDDDSNFNDIPDADFDERSTFSTNFLEDDDFGSKSDSFVGAVQSNEINPQMQLAPTSKKAVTINQTMYADDYIEWANAQNAESSNNNEVGLKESSNAVVQVEPPAMGMSFQKETMSPAEKEAVHITELQQLLPGLSRKRIEKISDEFSRVLGYPSILRLALVLRENMPDDLSPQWLVKKNLANARHLMAEAEKEGLIDIHLLNGMLQVEANSGRIEPAYRFHGTEFEKHGLTPTTYSDRLLLQMLVKHKRIPRAFQLKESIENKGRKLDLLSYGSLVEHFGNRRQLGSALMLINECIDVHGVPPGEKSLKNIRLLCRQKGLTKKVRLEEMIGKDPLQWIREGEQMKRDRKKTGSKLQFVANRLIDI